MLELPFPFFTDDYAAQSAPGRWDELHLYTGSRCNRACKFCCVCGDVDGSYAPWREETLATALQLVAPGGSLKFYGGEPTLDAANQAWALRHLRERGFRGAFTVFSNGIKADALLAILDADAEAVAVLNYAIATGRGEKPIPPSAVRTLTEWAAAHPRRVFLSHDFIVPVGRQKDTDDSAPTKCFRCYPTLTSTGRLHACPFAVEEAHPRYDLGGVETAREKFAAFHNWIAREIEPVAAAQNRNACAVCVARAKPLPMAR